MNGGVAQARLHSIARALDFGGPGDAIDNLEGALHDMKRAGADAGCIRTVERVQDQIAKVFAIIGPMAIEETGSDG